MAFLDSIPWWAALAAALTLGLAPFTPEPHIVEKFRMLFTGTLTRPLDMFDLALHVAAVCRQVGPHGRKPGVASSGINNFVATRYRTRSAARLPLLAAGR